MSVHFCFAGCVGVAEDKHVIISQQALEAVPDSVLTKLAIDGVWKKDTGDGTAAHHPIVIKPLEAPIQDEWTPAMADMIVNAYQWWLEQKEKESGNPVGDDDEEGESRRLIKLPDGVELEDALVVLDYYFAIGEELWADAVNCVDFSECRVDVQARAKLLLKWMKDAEQTLRFIVETLKSNPKRATLFLFASQKHDMDYINRNNDDDTFVRVGGDNECDSHLEWIENKRLRERLVLSLEYKAGLKANFVKRNYFPWPDNNVPRQQRYRPPDEKSLVCVAPDQYNDFDYEVHELLILRVEVPAAPKERKMQEIDHHCNC